MVDLVSSMLIYRPNERVHPLRALSCEAFAELRDKNTRLPDGKPIRLDLFNFTETELNVHPQITQELLALSASSTSSSSSIDSNSNGHNHLNEHGDTTMVSE